MRVEKANTIKIINVKPVPLDANPETHPPPELQEFGVMMALSKITRPPLTLTDTDPDLSPITSKRLLRRLNLEGQLHNPSSCGDCSIKQVSVLEKILTVTQYAYREGCSFTDALIQVQYIYLKALGDKDCNYVKLFAMDFSKAFDNVKHSLVGEKLKALHLNPNVVNWYLSFLMDRKQRLIFKGVTYKWHWL